jgi:hypothetical protein
VGCLTLGLRLIVGDDQYLRFEYPDGERSFSVDLVDERLAGERSPSISKPATSTPRPPCWQ